MSQPPSPLTTRDGTGNRRGGALGPPAFLFGVGRKGNRLLPCPTLAHTLGFATLITIISICGCLHGASAQPRVSFRFAERVLYYGQARFQGKKAPLSATYSNNKGAQQFSRLARRRGPSETIGLRGAAAALTQKPAKMLTVKKATPAVNIKGINAANAGGVSPPDVTMCVGNGYVVQAVNLAIAVYDSSGKLKAGVQSLNQFLGLLPSRTTLKNGTVVAGDFLSDPHCVYDKDTRRFFMAVLWAAFETTACALDIFGVTRTDLLSGTRSGCGTIVAISSKGDPTKPWAVHFIPGTNDGVNSTNDVAAPLFYSASILQDFPQITVDAYGIYISVRQFGTKFESGGLLGSNIYAISKKQLTSGLRTFQALRFAIPQTLAPFSDFIRPARTAGDSTYDTRGKGTTYFASLPQKTNTQQFTVVLWAITHTKSLNSGTPDPKLQMEFVTTPTWYFANAYIVQKSTSATTGMTGPIDSGSSLFQSLAYQKKKLVFVFSVAFQSRSAVGVAYGVVKTSVPTNSGTVQYSLDTFRTFGVPGQSLIYPSVGMNRKSKSLIGFSLVGLKYFPSAAYTYVDSKAQLSESVYIAAAGVGPSANARYGDWQTVAIDEKGAGWAAAEYVSGMQSGNWATSIVKANL